MFKGFFSYQIEHHRTHPFLKNFELAQLFRFVSSDLELAQPPSFSVLRTASSRSCSSRRLPCMPRRSPAVI